MPERLQTTVHCPYCAEPIQVLLDPEEAGQQYIEDCQVCCRPIVMTLAASGDEVWVSREDD